LYSLVFKGRFSAFAVAFLFLSFLIQPFHQALANEAIEEVETEAVLPEEVAEQLPSVVIEGETEELTTVDELIEGQSDLNIEESAPESIEQEFSVDPVINDESAASPNTGTSNDGAEIIVNEQLSEPSVISKEEQLPDVVTTEASESAGGDSGLDISAEEQVSSSNIEDDDTPSTSNELIDEKAIEAGVNDLVGSVVNEVVTLTRQMVTEENFYQFSRQSCVAVGDGTFHCTSKERATLDPDSAVYADRDEAGDMEIYMRTSKGDIKQLSDNDYDDTAPDMDLASMRAVWQRLVDGRYQIISYDLEERKETQLTFSRTNSMEPKVAKEGVVWQAWDGNDWEIMFFDGQVTDQITDNEIQDVTPVIEDGYVLWSVLGGEASEARVYSIESGELMTITGHEGGAVANPRFVLVYDTKFDNGDVITQGFDPVTGLATPLSSKPAELPFNIPEPDPVGEIRALIQNKSTQKDKEVITVPVTTDGGDLNLASTSVTTTDTLVLSGTTDLGDETAILYTEPEPDFELTEYDLVITKEASSTNSVLNRQFYLDIGAVESASSTQR